MTMEINGTTIEEVAKMNENETSMRDERKATFYEPPKHDTGNEENEEYMNIMKMIRGEKSKRPENMNFNSGNF